MGSQLFVVIPDPQIARDLLVTNGSIFSSRKRYFMKNQVILRGRAIKASEYGDKWRQHRRIATQLLTPKALQGYLDVMDYEAHIFIRSLYEQSKGGLLPVNPAHYCGRFALNNMLIISFATRTGSTSVPLVEKALELAMEFMDLTGPWSNAIDFLEPLQWIPTKMRARRQKLHDGLVEVYGSMINRVQARMDSGEDVPDCLVKTLIQTGEQEKLDWEDLCMLSAVFTLGGVHSAADLSSLPVAERELWLAISRLLWSFKFESLPKEPISLEEYEGLSGRVPLPFRLKLLPRVERLGEFLQSKEEIVMAF
ncbi:hypothetical protein C0995_016619 [Termitomyces sp. Mi166|nr:hypothetical protein C0995_016619 [Termitomyces sp. Mi166\